MNLTCILIEVEERKTPGVCDGFKRFNVLRRDLPSPPATAICFTARNIAVATCTWDRPEKLGSPCLTGTGNEQDVWETIQVGVSELYRNGKSGGVGSVRHEKR